MINTLDATLESWLQELKPYQRKNIDALLRINNNNLDIVAEIYLSADGAPDTVKFGGTKGGNNVFFKNLKQEVEKFVCGDTKYDYFHTLIKNLITPNKTKGGIATIICTALYGELGKLGISISIAAIYPVVVILLASMAAIGINTYCVSYVTVDKK